MNKQLFLALLLCITAAVSKAAPGDTTWVQAHNDKWLDYYNNFDTTVTFPDGTKTYRKIYMVFTLGKYACPGNPQYCSDWDYTVQNYLMTPGGDTVELSRLITPYGKGPRLGSNTAWKGRYIYDVTDFYPLLKNSATVRIHYSGYSGGFTANIRFAFVEGTPARNVLGVTKIWGGSFAYGKSSDPIENHVPAVTKTAPANAQSAELKFNVTGHGADGTGCSEFCSKYYQVLVNGNQVDQKDIWRDNCPANWLYPQSGTWPFERGNWCPGDLVYPNTHKLTGVTGGSSYSVDVNFETYADNGSASYTLEGNVFYYGAFNHTTDVAMEDIIAPTDFEGHFRENTACDHPSVKIKNYGSNTVTSVTIEYGIQGKFLPSYTWTGTLAPLAETVVVLPATWDMYNAVGTSSFVATVKAVNGAADQDATNDKLTSNFVAAPRFGSQLIVVLRTNGSLFGGVSETSWKLYDANNNVVKERTNAAASTTYNDTLNLTPGCYKLQVEDKGDDGVNFWYYQYYPTNPGTGYVQLRNPGSAIGLNLTGYFGGDFGRGFTQYFTTGFPQGVEEINQQQAGAIQAYPNPAHNNVTIELSGLQRADGVLEITDAMGRIVKRQATTDMQLKLDISSFANGVYQVVFQNKGGEKLVTRLVIAH